MRAGAPDFWSDQEAAQAVLRDRKRSEDQIAADDRLTALAGDIETYIALAAEETNAEQRNDLLKDLDRELTTAENYIGEMETRTLLSGETDHLNAIMTIKPGAGGTESQDWASILLRMYLRWAERKGMSAIVLDETPGEEAGIKNATIQFAGENAYGLLTGETGVHRLVRISPFDANARRHTSFASVFVYPQVDDEIKIDIKLDDLRIDTFRASGAGGQHVNMTDSAVRITHFPTNIVVQCQNERSQHKNRDSAMKQLRARLYEFELEKKREESRKTEASKLEINFGSQIRSYVLAPYRMIKDHRTKLAIGDVDRILDGAMDPLMHAWLVWRKTGKTAKDSGDDLPD